LDTSLLTIQEDTTIFTNINTGEFQIELPPMNYVVKQVNIPSNSDISLGPDKILNISNQNVTTTIIDTLRRDNTQEIISIDSVTYHTQYDYIYRADPVIEITNVNGSDPFSGDTEFIYGNPKFGVDTIDLVANPLIYPVFTQNNRYRALISTFESYSNKDGSNEVIDKVPVTEGKITISNNLSNKPGVEIDLTNASGYRGDTIYTFRAGSPNMNINQAIPDYSFTKALTIDLISGSKTASWLPNGANMPPNGNSFFRGYVLGTEDVDPSDVVTQGPQLVDYILRDPPGSQSSATRSKETSVVTEDTWQWNVDGGTNSNRAVFAGTDTRSGIGFINFTSTENTLRFELVTL